MYFGTKNYLKSNHNHTIKHTSKEKKKVVDRFELRLK
jgi:hypothetical protein